MGFPETTSSHFGKPTIILEAVSAAQQGLFLCIKYSLLVKTELIEGLNVNQHATHSRFDGFSAGLGGER